MTFHMYDPTPRKKAPKALNFFLISFFAFLAATFLLVSIVISITDKSILPFLITFLSVSFFAFVISIRLYDMRKAYIKIEHEIITVVDYPFFKKRERAVCLKEIKKLEWRGGGGIASMPHIVFKNEKNKTLFHIIYVPETKVYFEKLGFEIK